MSEYRDKLRSIGFVGKAPESRKTVERTEDSTVIHTEHDDGRVDAVVRPDTVRYGARVHRTGAKRGQVAETREMTQKERQDRYGPSG